MFFAERIIHTQCFLYSIMIFLHNCPILLKLSLQFIYFTNSYILGLTSSARDNNPILSFTNFTHSIKQWYSSSMTLQISHFLSSYLIFFAPHLPLSTKNKCKLRRIFDTYIFFWSYSLN